MDIRMKGITAFIRVKNEEEYIKPCLLSIKDFFDEIHVWFNLSTDRTEEIVDGLELPNLKKFYYNHPCEKAGDGYYERLCQREDKTTASLAAYYNTCLSQIKTTHACKWDGDMVALPSIDKALKSSVLDLDCVYITGTDLVAGLEYQNEKSYTDFEPRFFKLSKETGYIDTPRFEFLLHPYDKNHIREHLFIHLKMAKVCNKEVANKGKKYTGILPPVLKEII